MTQRKLAAALECNHAMIQRWREIHKDAPAENDPQPWEAFLRKRGLHKYSGRANAPIRSIPRQDDDDGGPGVAVFSSTAWDARASVLFELAEVTHTAFTRGDLTPGEYAETALATLTCICDLAKAWNVPLSEFDPKGFRATVEEIVDGRKAPAGCEISMQTTCKTKRAPVHMFT